METLSCTEVRKHFSNMINKVSFGKKRILLERQGKPLLAIIPLEDLEILEQAERHPGVMAAKKTGLYGLTKSSRPIHALLKKLSQIEEKK